MSNQKRLEEIEKIVLGFLEENRNRYYSLKDLSRLLPLRKHEHKNLKEILNSLKREGKIILKNRQFGVKSEPKSKIVTGKFDAGSLVRGYSYAFVNTPEGDIFIDSEDISNAYHNDEVLVEIKYKRRGLFYGRIQSIKKRANTHLTGNIEHYQKRYYFIPDLGKIHTTFEISDLAGAKPNQKVNLKVEDWGNREENKKPKGKVVEILGEAGDTKIEELALIKQFELPLEFTAEIMDEVALLDEKIDKEEIERRKDLREILTLTIDPQSAKDYDDAISYVLNDSKHYLYVHIADVSYYIRTDSNLFNEAVTRGNSFYFPRTVIPMLPERLSNKICSLRPDEDKLTMTVLTVFDNEFNIVEQSVFESVIRSSARLNYEEVDALFEDKEHGIEPAVAETLQQLRKISAVLSERRYSKGYIPFNMPDTDFVFDDEGNIKNMIRSSETESHKLIENFMLLANEYTATILHKKADEAIYRVHEYPDEGSVDKILTLLNYYRIKHKKNQRMHKLIQGLLASMPNRDYHRVFDPLILRSMMKARYDTLPLGHFGLAMKNYTHFTSPIRRVCDLAVHHLIREYILRQNDGHRIKPGLLKKIADTASEREIHADNAERETAYQFKKIFMKDKIGEIYTGLVVNMNNNNIIVELDDIPVSGLIPLSSLQDDYYSFYSRYMEIIGKRGKRVFRLLDRLKVKLERIDFDLVFSLIEEK